MEWYHYLIATIIVYAFGFFTGFSSGVAAATLKWLRYGAQKPGGSPAYDLDALRAMARATGRGKTE